MKGINFQRELLSICKLHSKTVGLFYPFKKNKTKIFLDTKMKKVLFLNYQNKSEISKKVWMNSQKIWYTRKRIVMPNE